MTEVKVPTLTRIQAELKAPKSQYNSFGKYKYRNVEDIYEGLKPLLVKYGASLRIEEKLDTIAGMPMVAETVVYTDDQHPKGEELRIEGHAPISQHKGMAPEQALGTAASYAKKYALGNLFLIDDSQDVDSMDNRQQSGYQRQPARSNSYRGNQGNYQPNPQQQAQERPLTANGAIELGKSTKYKEPNTQAVVSAYDLLIAVKAETARGEKGDYTALYETKVKDPKQKKIIVEVYKAMKEKGVI